MIGLPMTETIIAPTHRFAHEQNVRRVLDPSLSLLGEWLELEGLHRSGRRIPLDMTVWIVTSERGTTFHALFRDLTRRRELEHALDQSGSLRELLDSAPDMITLSDTSGFFYASPACRGILGYEPEELLRISIEKLVHAEDLETVQVAHAKALAADGSFGCSCRLQAKDGHYVWLESRGTAARRDGEGHVAAIEAVWRDVSARVILTQERARTTSLLEAANAKLAEALDREHQAVEELRELDRAKTDFVSTVSHELRTPLTSILGYLEILGDEDESSWDPEQAVAVEVIDRNARRLLAMIENLLTIGRVEGGELTVSPVSTAVVPMIDAAVRAVLPAAQEEGLDIHVDLPADLPQVMADAEHIDRVLLNLLSNCIKFTPRGRHIDITARAEPHEVVVTVRDDGIGIPEQDHGKLFQRFSRGSEAAVRATQGNGLGLFIVQRIVELHGGNVALRSAAGKGTEIDFSLPVAAAPDELAATFASGEPTLAEEMA